MRIETEIEKQLEVMLQQGKKNPAQPWGIGVGQRELGLGLGLGRLPELARHHRACPALSQA